MVDCVIARWKHRRFVWGLHDCGRFAADAILAMTGNVALKKGELIFESPEVLHASFSGDQLLGLFRDLLEKTGMRKTEAPQNEGIAIVKLGRSTPALAVWDGLKLWMISKKGLREIDPAVAFEWWEKS